MSIATSASNAPRELLAQALLDAYFKLKSVELGAKIGASKERRKICLQGTNMPAHPQHPHPGPSGGELGDYKTPAQCSEYLANLDQYWAYSPSPPSLTP